MATVHITYNNFTEEVINSKKPVLLDFWAPWCGPCKMLLPIIEDLAESDESVKICKINGDEEPELINQFKVRSVPTLIVVKDGQEVNRSIGLKNKKEILELLA
jgi:thioredoxin 1